MRFTPNHNWPVAEDADVVKQYPTTVDQPFKDALDLVVPTVASTNLSGTLAFDAVIIKFGTYAPVILTGGYAYVNFDVPFPNGCHYAIASIGDDTDLVYMLRVEHTTYTPAKFTVRCYKHDSVPAEPPSIVRVNYVAIGW